MRDHPCHVDGIASLLTFKSLRPFAKLRALTSSSPPAHMPPKPGLSCIPRGISSTSLSHATGAWLAVEVTLAVRATRMRLDRSFGLILDALVISDSEQDDAVRRAALHLHKSAVSRGRAGIYQHSSGT